MSVLAESLESRTLMAAQYNLLTLLHYDRPGSSWTYGLTDTTVTNGKTTTGSATAVVAVSTTKVGTAASDLINLKIGKLNLGAAFYTNSKGTYIDLVAEPSTLGTIPVKITSTMVGPPKLTVGKSNTGKGTFSGTFSGTLKGQKFAATISGTDSISDNLIGVRTAHVPAGTFSTVEGNYTVNLTGKISVTTAGHTFKGTFSALHEQTFYAAPGVGIVRFTQIDTANVNVSGLIKTSTQITSRGNLISDVLK